MSKKRLKTIKTKIDFEKQSIENIYNFDLNITDRYKLLFTDGYYVEITDKVTHIKNDENVEVIAYNKDKKLLLHTWANDAEVHSASFLIWVWSMELIINENNIYTLIIKRGEPVGGGFL